MSWLRRFLFRLGSMFRRRNIEKEMSEEIQLHLDMQAEANIAQGMSPDEARLAAVREFGRVDKIKENYRDERSVQWLDNLGRDLRFGARMLHKNPSFTALSMLSLGLGIGVNIVAFGLINALVFRPLPGAKDPDQLVYLHPLVSGTVPYPEFAYCKEHGKTLVGLEASAPLPDNIILEVPGENEPSGAPEYIHDARLISGNYFALLGGEMEFGRSFLPDEDREPGKHPVLILEHDFWKVRFNADPAIVGKTIRLNSVSFTVVGIAKDTFPLEPGTISMPSVWIPMMMSGVLEPRQDLLNTKDGTRSGVHFFGRKRPDAGYSEVKAELGSLDDQYSLEYLKPDLHRRSWALGLEHGFSFLPWSSSVQMRAVIVGILALTGVVLSIACANVANLLLARATSRQREISVRLALGASRGRLVSQLLTESIMLACLGGLLAVLVGIWCGQLIWPMALHLNLGSGMQRLFGLDWRMAAYAFCVSLITGVVFGLIPALETTNSSIRSGLQREHSAIWLKISRNRMRSILVSSQISAAVTLLILASLTVRMIQKNTSLDLPFDPHRIYFFEYSAPSSAHVTQHPLEFQHTFTDQIRALPGVNSASMGEIWYGLNLDRTTLKIDGRPIDAGNGLNGSRVTPDYFGMLGVGFTRGRNFTDDEVRTGAHVLIVSDAFAQRFWPGQDALGHQLHVNGAKGASAKEIDGVVVGIVREGVREIRSRWEYKPLVGDLYSPLTQIDPTWSEVWVRTENGTGDILRQVPQLALRLDKDVFIRSRGTLAKLLEIWKTETLVASSVVAILGTLSLILAAFGIYGVMAYAVAQRTHEIGVRMALGADRSAIMRWVLWDGSRSVAWGVALGALCAAGMSWLERSALYGISPLDPMAFGGVALLLAIVALLACWFPARRATSVNPIDALRCE